jgi:hypothetical protein
MSQPTQLSLGADATAARMPPRRPADWFACCLFGLCLFYGAYTLSIALSPRVAAFAMRRFQLADDDFLFWAVFAPAPFMYNFDNRVTVSQRPLSRAELVDAGPAQWLVLNHYPARVLTYFDLRRRAFARPSTSYVYLESRYREQRVVTGYRVSYPTEGSGASAVIERWNTGTR